MANTMKIEWDNPDIEKLDKHFSKINKLYGAMDTTELPFMLIQKAFIFGRSSSRLFLTISFLPRLSVGSSTKKSSYLA